MRFKQEHPFGRMLRHPGCSVLLSVGISVKFPLWQCFPLCFLRTDISDPLEGSDWSLEGLQLLLRSQQYSLEPASLLDVSVAGRAASNRAVKFPEVPLGCDSGHAACSHVAFCLPRVACGVTALF